MAGMIRIVIIDDHPSTAQGLAELLAHEEDLEVVGMASDVKLGLQLVREVVPDVVICDIQLQGEPNGFEILRQLGGQVPPAVMFFSSFEYAAFQQKALELGARGYIVKTSGVREIIGAIRQIAGGGMAFMASAIRGTNAGPRLPSPRELELIRFVKAGLSNDEVAVRLGIGTRGVESSLRRMFQRYGAMSRTELVGIAEEQGWTALPQ